ncbi:Hypothetical predicted protein [Olea europaea subsp. europaea]|uniref:Uncharacterized protein n=1 Tax=Olea europaea subsp. europaea TaxID=158383 RepID=A0A8S0VJS6_OLEEU|nr:Hypothetical predicted protein [Olea europaea subsp. europaea]
MHRLNITVEVYLIDIIRPGRIFASLEAVPACGCGPMRTFEKAANRRSPMKSSKQNWFSVFQELNGQETGVLQNGSFGMALMCMTSTAKRGNGIMFSSGGMPSSHSAICTALTTTVAMWPTHCSQFVWGLA